MQDLDIWNLIFFIEAILGLGIVFFLIRLTKKNLIYLPLTLFTLLSVIELGFLILKNSGLIYELPHLIGINEPLFLLYGPLLYLYTRNQLYRRAFFTKSDMLFLIPFLLSTFSYLPDYFVSSGEKINQAILERDLGFNVESYLWEWNFYLLVNGTFLVMALKKLNTFSTNQKIQFSDISNTDLSLTKILIKACLGLYVIELVFVYLTYYGMAYPSEIYVLLNTLTGVVLLLVGLDAIISYRFIENNQKALADLPFQEIGQSAQPIKYAKSALDEVSSQKIKSDLLEYMDAHKPYLQPQLRIKELSELTGIPAHHISQVINEGFQQNFYEFINEYRVKEAMRILADSKYQNYTYEAIGFEVGFNSKSAFYAAFKRVNNTTPAKFLP